MTRLRNLQIAAIQAADLRKKRSEAHRIKMRYSADNDLAHRHNSRARLNGVEGTFTGKELWEVREKQQFHCAYCQRQMTVHTLTVDHIIPITRGGSNFISNACLACAKCNLDKSDRSPEEWVMRWYRPHKNQIGRGEHSTVSSGKPKVINRLPDLLAEKFGGEENINLKQLERDTSLSYPTVLSWAKGRVDRVDLSVLAAWCKYLDCGTCDILVYEPDA